jgi:anti-sigma B factor antagonist
MRIDTSFHDGVSRLAISGDVDLATADELREAGEKALTDACSTLRIDLSGVSFMDSTGLSALVAINNAARHNHTVVLDDPTPPVRRILQVSGLDQVLRIATAATTQRAS